MFYHCVRWFCFSVHICSPVPLYILHESWGGSSRAISDFQVVDGLMAFMWMAPDFCSMWRSTLMIEYMCMRCLSWTTSDPLSPHILWFRCKAYSTSPHEYAAHEYASSPPARGSLIDSTQGPSSGSIPIWEQPRGVGELTPSGVNIWSIQGRSQWIHSSLFLPMMRRSWHDFWGAKSHRLGDQQQLAVASSIPQPYTDPPFFPGLLPLPPTPTPLCEMWDCASW